MKKNIYQATGKRKTSIAQIVLSIKKAGKKSKIIIVNDSLNKTLSLENYFPSEILVNKAQEPLILTNSKNKFDIKIKVQGGGFNGQCEAVCHGIARALIKFSDENTSILKEHKLLTRDVRFKERKKYGLKKARKAPQFSKR